MYACDTTSLIMAGCEDLTEFLTQRVKGCDSASCKHQAKGQMFTRRRPVTSQPIVIPLTTVRWLCRRTKGEKARIVRVLVGTEMKLMFAMSTVS